MPPSPSPSSLLLLTSRPVFVACSRLQTLRFQSSLSAITAILSHPRRSTLGLAASRSDTDRRNFAHRRVSPLDELKMQHQQQLAGDQPSLAFRENYGNHGVVGYYTRFGASYSNPHNDAIFRALGTCLSRWVDLSHSGLPQHQERQPNAGVRLNRVLDLACGSGEATLCVERWAAAHGLRVVRPQPAVASSSADDTALAPADTTSTADTTTTTTTTTTAPSKPQPISPIILESVALEPTTSTTTGTSNEAHQELNDAAAAVLVEGTDPFTADAFVRHTAHLAMPLALNSTNVELIAARPHRTIMYDILIRGHCKGRSRVAVRHRYAPNGAACCESSGSLTFEMRRTVICSFALHLVADKSLLFSVCTQLSLMSDHLIVITPHKRPNIEPHMGWTLLDEQVIDRVRLRLYRSAYCSSHAS